MKVMKQTGQVLRYETEETEEERELQRHIDTVTQGAHPYPNVSLSDVVRSLCFLVLKGYTDGINLQDTERASTETVSPKQDTPS